LKSNFKAEATDVDSIQTKQKFGKGKRRQCMLEQMIKAVIRHSQVTRYGACGVVY